MHDLLEGHGGILGLALAYNLALRGVGDIVVIDHVVVIAAGVVIADRPLKEYVPLAKNGEDVIIVPAVSDEAAKAKYPNGWKAPKPYLRIVPMPKS